MHLPGVVSKTFFLRRQECLRITLVRSTLYEQLFVTAYEQTPDCPSMSGLHMLQKHASFPEG
jgi:hypothetical protein